MLFGVVCALTGAGPIEAKAAAVNEIVVRRRERFM
jgi:hypothetical protein